MSGSLRVPRVVNVYFFYFNTFCFLHLAIGCDIIIGKWRAENAMMSMAGSLLLPLLLLLLSTTVTVSFSSLFSFGDSLTDTGNLFFISSPQSPNCLLPPYGQTYFHRPTGRCSDGRLILDFLGTAQIPPYPLAFSINFSH